MSIREDSTVKCRRWRRLPTDGAEGRRDPMGPARRGGARGRAVVAWALAATALFPVTGSASGRHELAVVLQFDPWDRSDVPPAGAVTIRTRPDGIAPAKTDSLHGEATVDYHASIPDSVEAPSIRVEVDPTPSWLPRKFGLWDPPRAPLHVHLLRAGAHFEKSCSIQARERLDAYHRDKRSAHSSALSNLDGALAYFEEFAPSRVEELLETDPAASAWYQYNYATSLASACVEGFTTCEASREQCAKLAEIIDVPDRKAILETLGVSQEQVSLCAALPAQVEAGLTYRRVRLAFQDAESLARSGESPDAAARYLEAARLADAALASYDANREAWVQNGITRSRLLDDAGTAYLLYGNRASADADRSLSSCAAWREAEDRLSRIPESDRDTAVRENLSTHLSARLLACPPSSPAA